MGMKTEKLRGSKEITTNNLDILEMDKFLERYKLSRLNQEETENIPLDCKHIKPISPKRKQPLVFIGRTDTEAEAPIFGHLMQRVNSLKETLML